jgi:hypothetical protein
MPQAPGADVQTPQPGPSRESLELLTLEARRSELRGQLSSINERRSLLVTQLRESEGTIRGELTQRIKGQDARTTRIENELNTIDDRISALMARGVRPPPSAFDRAMEAGVPAGPPIPAFPPNEPNPAVFPGGYVGVGPTDPFNSPWGELFGGMLAIQGLTFALLLVVLWRSFRRHVSTRLSGEDANRIEQLQRSVDVMAVEVERISESQRFTAKMLNQQVAEPVSVAKDAERVR